MKATESDLAMWMTMGDMKTEIDTSTTAGKIAVMQAFADGKKIQAMTKGRIIWDDIKANPCWDWSYFNYRIVPQPKTRPLRASDWDGMPVVWARDLEDKEIKQDMLVTGIDNKGFDLGPFRIHWNETSDMQWSVDRKTWKPFTVEDTQ